VGGWETITSIIEEGATQDVTKAFDAAHRSKTRATMIP
jgi:hypothetical protein